MMVNLVDIKRIDHVINELDKLLIERDNLDIELRYKLRSIKEILETTKKKERKHFIIR